MILTEELYGYYDDLILLDKRGNDHKKLILHLSKIYEK